MEYVTSSGNFPFKVTAVAAGEAHTLLLTGNQLSILVIVLFIKKKKLVKIVVYIFLMPCFLSSVDFFSLILLHSRF